MKHAQLIFALVACTALGAHAAGPVEFKESWRESALAPAELLFQIRGTEERNNPLRRELRQPFSGDQLFVHFRILYPATSIDTPADGDGEFVVLWLDTQEGDDSSTHSGGTPNVGLHVTENQNRFMVRFASGRESFAPTELVGDRSFQVIGRLSKPEPGSEQPFTRLELWVDPQLDEATSPHATISTTAASLSSVGWIGFSTGRKTEISDTILVSDVRLAESWDAIHQLPELPELTSEPEIAPPPPAPHTVSFAEQVVPLLRSRCFECHSGAEPTAGLRLDVLDEVLNQVSPRDAENSHLIAVVAGRIDDKRMPPADSAKPLTENEISLLRTWIDEGVRWDEDLLPTPTPHTDHWSLQAIRRPPVPRVKASDWVRTPVDAFVARRHEQMGLRPAEAASETTLRRRLALDLTGLPPDRFNSATTSSIDAFVEAALASKAYGERWGRHWLDVARWAESNGHQHNRLRPFAWRYRDYVIESLNKDKPFDLFLREQIAGDELPYSRDRLIATGFLAAARYSGNDLDKAIQRNDILVDVVNTTTKTFLGLTVECAQCHTHKFDPITIRDYYRLQAFFADGQPNNLSFEQRDDRLARLVAARWDLFDRVHQRMVEQRRAKGYPEPILVIPKSVVGGMARDERRTFDRLESQIGKFSQTWAWNSPSRAAPNVVVTPHEMRWPLPHDPRLLARREAFLLIRGEVTNPGPHVDPSLPAVFASSVAPSSDNSSPTRLDLANWMVSDSNPLTARVWVNRVWHWHFGQGLVQTPDDFGSQGAAPSHPELLDWLACELIDHGWSTKHIHRLILNSNTFRQASTFSSQNHSLDPENRFLWRWRPRRLEAESLRDSILATSGLLIDSVGGPSVPRVNESTTLRRSIYLEQKRDQLPRHQMLFDGTNAVTTCGRRRVSTVPLQPLYLLNHAFMQKMADSFATRVRAAAADEEAQVRLAIQLTLSREATTEEIAQGRKFLDTDRLEDFCLVLFNLNEFAYLP